MVEREWVFGVLDGKRGKRYKPVSISLLGERGELEIAVPK